MATLPWWSSIQSACVPSAGIPDHDPSPKTRSSHRAAAAGSSVVYSVSTSVSVTT